MKTDLRKTLDRYRAKRGEFRDIVVPPTRYLMVDGHGDPNVSPEFTSALEALYPAAYALKFASKAQGRDYVVPPLEGLWWADDMDSFTSARDKSQWHFTVMILIPDWLDETTVDAALEKAATKNASVPQRVRVETLDEGRCIQTLHIGSFDEEASVLQDVHTRVIPDAALTMTGKHHEIYLTDSRRTEPAKQRTILRQPVR